MSNPENPDRDESVASATRALADATAALTRLLGHQVGAISEDVGRAVSEGMREASRGLAQASESVARAGSHVPPSRKERADQTRTDLLDAMARVVAARGFEGASVGDVAAEAGYTKGALYANFSSKSELFATLVQREADEGRLLPLPPLTPAEHAAKDGAGAADAATASALLAAEALGHAARNAQDRAALRPELESELDRVAARVRAARAARRGRTTEDIGPADQDDRDTALALVGITLAARMLAVATDGAVGDEAGVERLTERLLVE